MINGYHGILSAKRDPGFMVEQPTTASFVQVANHALLQITGPLTLEMWLNPAAYSRYGLWGKGFNEYAINLETPGNNFPNISYYHGGTSGQANNMTNGMLAGVWTHLALTRSAPVAGVYTIRLYVNGTLTDTRTMTHAPVLSNTAVNIGRRDAASTNLVGYWTEARIWNVERTAQQVADNWNKRITAAETGLVEVWPGSGSGTGITGIINGRNGILQGAAVRVASTAPLN